MLELTWDDLMLPQEIANLPTRHLPTVIFMFFSLFIILLSELYVGDKILLIREAFDDNLVPNSRNSFHPNASQKFFQFNGRFSSSAVGRLFRA